ncbi:type II toxin-antitoxin system death-on-curing family toxin [Aeromonas fluvialis]|uniref:type II toxin-antitoxin system death-on-curing family toxin n=1 Tax=Aeromonas fluvialis TaxID=591962 RepID=UPI0005A9BB35|nr:type II toxin-antitoxin system death-on-curing family toxin [Aeromonas fluvialis]
MALLTLYFDIAHAVAVHDWIIDQTGGHPGILDQGRLDSALQHIQNDDYYPTFEEKLTHLVFAINKFHAFNDGNKRSSLTLGAYFLTLNGYDYCVPKFVTEMENIVVAVADNKIGKPLLQRLITSLIEDDDYPDELKLLLYEELGGDEMDVD